MAACSPRSRIAETISQGCIGRSCKSAIAASASGLPTLGLVRDPLPPTFYLSSTLKTVRSLAPPDASNS